MRGKMKWTRHAVFWLAVVLVLSILFEGLQPITSASPQPDLPIPEDETASVVQLIVPDLEGIEKLQELDIDLAHRIHENNGGNRG